MCGSSLRVCTSFATWTLPVLLRCSDAMPACDDEQILAAVESSLKFQMDRAGVPRAIQLLVYRKGFDNVIVFSGIDESREAVREALKQELPLDYTKDAESRKAMALLVHVWQTCRAQLTAQEKNHLDSKCGVQPRLLQTTEHATMKAAVEVFNGRLTDKELPSKSLLAQKLEQVEDNAPHAEDMRDVTSVEDAESESYNALIDPSTNFLRIKPLRRAPRKSCGCATDASVLRGKWCAPSIALVLGFLNDA